MNYRFAPIVIHIEHLRCFWEWFYY